MSIYEIIYFITGALIGFIYSIYYFTTKGRNDASDETVFFISIALSMGFAAFWPLCLLGLSAQFIVNKINQKNKYN